MPSWRDIVGELSVDAEALFDTLKGRFSKRMGWGDTLCIMPYRGYGTAERIVLRGRVLENEGISGAQEADTVWDNLVNMYRRFESDEVAGAQVRGIFQGETFEATTSDEGFFEMTITPSTPPPTDRLWHEVALELVSPVRADGAPVRASGLVLVPPPSATFGVLSDIDDTVLQTDATNMLNMARTVFLGNARTRLPFKGVAAFYQALQTGISGQAMNPLFYVSSSPWNLYDLLVDFFGLQNIPIGPIALRDWGVSRSELLPIHHHAYKLGAIRHILDAYPTLPFLLIGDSGQEDPEIYAEVVKLYPGRIMAVYIRNVSRDLERPAAIEALATEVAEQGSTLILAPDTLAAARHAITQGWVKPDAFPEIEAEKQSDEAPDEATVPSTDAPTVVVSGEAAPVVSQVMQEVGSAEAAPTVVVSPEPASEMADTIDSAEVGTAPPTAVVEQPTTAAVEAAAKTVASEETPPQQP